MNFEQSKLPKTERNDEKRVTPQEDIDILNVYVQSCKINKEKLIEMKGYVDTSKLIVGDFKTLLSKIDRPKEKVSRYIEKINIITYQRI